MSKILFLDLELYPERFIKKAMHNYHEFAEIAFTKRDELVEMFFERCLYDEEQTVREFENHLIELCNIRSR
jgi:hypothetical protein